MAKRQTKRQTPAGTAIQVRELTEDFDVGYRKHHPLDSYLFNLWDMGESSEYLRLKNVRSIPISTYMEMLLDYQIAIAELFVRTPLLNAPWRIEHPDDDVRAFLTAVWDPLHDKFFLSAAKAVMLGWMPMIKYLAFRAPRPTDAQRKEGIEPWRGTATPVVVPRIEALSPATARAHISKGGAFTGIDFTLKVADDGRDVPDVGLNNTVWVVRGREDAFGDLYGQGRLTTGYRPWWDRTFLNALFMRHCERAIDPAVIVEHPPGYQEDPKHPDQKGTKFSVKAMEVGQALRSGATVTVSSEPYANEDGTYTSIQKWKVNTDLANLENVEAFEAVLTRKDADVLLGVLIPPAAVSSKYAKETLGGKSMVEILQDLAVNMLLGEWETLAAAAEQWVLDWLVAANFGGDRADAQLVTDGFSAEDEEALREFVGVLMNKAPDIVQEYIDGREIVKRAGLPLREEQEVALPQPEQEGEEAPELEAALTLAIAEAFTEEERQERAREIVQETSTEALEEGDWRVVQADIAKARQVWGELPEVTPVMTEA